MKYDKNIVQAWFRQHGLDAEAEYKFHPDRKWKFDFCWPEELVALEVEGGVWSGGRHTRPAGFLKDMEKYNAAAKMGWRVLRTTPTELCMQETVDLVKETLGKK